MIPPIVCFCGNAIARAYWLYTQAKQERTIQFYHQQGMNQIHPDFLHLINEGIQMGDVLDKLHIYNDCCRTRIVSHVNIGDM